MRVVDGGVTDQQLSGTNPTTTESFYPSCRWTRLSFQVDFQCGQGMSSKWNYILRLPSIQVILQDARTRAMKGAQRQPYCILYARWGETNTYQFCFGERHSGELLGIPGNPSNRTAAAPRDVRQRPSFGPLEALHSIQDPSVWSSYCPVIQETGQCKTTKQAISLELRPVRKGDIFG